jgi:hypothetical protein
VTVSGEGKISAAEIQDQIARLCPTHKQWTWDAVPFGENFFKITLPSKEDMIRCNGMEFMVRTNKVMLSIDYLEHGSDHSIF